MATNYKRLTQQLTGMTDAEYRRAYKDIAARTHNYNAIAGTTYNPAQTLYLSHRYAGNLSAGVANILATPATRARYAGQSVTEAVGQSTTQRVTDAATSAILDRWGGFIGQSRADKSSGFGAGEAARIADALKAGTITPAQANEMLKALKEATATRREKDPAYKY